MSAIAAPDAPKPPALTSPSRWLADLPLLVVGVLLASTAADILPGDTIVGVGEVQLNLARILLLIGLAALAYTAGPRALLVRTGIAIPLALLLLVALYTSHKWGTFPRYRFLVEGVAAFYLAAATVRSRDDARDALAAIGLIALAIAGLAAVAQVSQGVQTGFYRHGCTPVTKPFGAAPPDSITRAVGTFANPNVLAGYLLLLVPVGALAGAFVARVRGLWLAVALAVGFGYLALILSFSRAAVLAALVAIGVGLLVAKVRNRRWLLLVAVGLGAVILFLLGSCGSDAAAGYGRSEEWRQTLDVIKDNPLWGVGLGRLGDVLHGRNPASTAQHAHNLWLTWWADAGTGALFAWVWIAIALIWRSVRGALAGDAVARATAMALIAFFAFSMLDHPANVDRVALAFWIVAGLGVASSPPAGRSWLRRRRPPPATRAPALPDTPGTGSPGNAPPAAPG
jgi:O-antigen ligase